LPTTVTVKELLEAGVHFGHQTRRWNPKMKEYIFGERSGIYIIDLQKTQKRFQEALRFAENLGARNQTLLFVGTKRQSQAVVAEEARRCAMPYVTERWLGGTLTNFVTVRKSIERIRELEMLAADTRQDRFTKKEMGRFAKERTNLERNLSGVRAMKALPDAMFVIDTRKEAIAVREARKLRIPVIGVVDTNCDPDEVDFVIPGNDDALRAIRLFAGRIADAILEGGGLREGQVPAPQAEQSEPAPPRPAAPEASPEATPEETTAPAPSA
jgi:small subunit ribosomal protein S2